MFLLLATTVLATTCCTTVGAQPTLLASCDKLAVTFGTGGDVEYGGWSWNGAWSGVGDDGGGNVVISAAVMGRFTPWLQGGGRIPLSLTMDRLDGETTTEFGLGSGLFWIDLETPAGWPSARAPHFALELGVGSEGASSASPGAKVVQGALRASGEAGRWTVWGNITGRMPFLGMAVPDGDASVVIDHTLGAKPTLLLTATPSDQIVLTARTDLPVTGFGRNTPSRMMISLDWYRVLTRS